MPVTNNEPIVKSRSSSSTRSAVAVQAKSSGFLNRRSQVRFMPGAPETHVQIRGTLGRMLLTVRRGSHSVLEFRENVRGVFHSVPNGCRRFPTLARFGTI